MTKTKKIWHMSQIKEANRAAGQYFFSPDTLRFFRSRVSETVHQGKGGIFFVTSEKHVSYLIDDQPRLYSVQRFDPEDGHVHTVGEFQEYTTLRQAQTAAKRFAEEGE